MAKYSSLFYTIFILDLLAYFVHGQLRPKITEHPADAVAAREEPLTLNCKASGRPTPEFKWYHNGSLLVPSDRRVILPEGSLFFLRVKQNKREQDSGVYWCEARNTAGVSVSHNATLQIAMLRNDFRAVPKDTVALVGGPVVLNCTPPRGIPEPSVLWSKDGKYLDLGGKRLSLVESGSLMISEVLATDAGQYECSAQSMAGSRAAPIALLKVLAPPTVIRGPQDTEVIEGEYLEFPCDLTGDPKPIVSWHRENGNLPEGRSRILLDYTLRIEDTRPEDQGNYICKGHNEGGNVSVAVKLSVYAIPTFIEAPSDVEVKEVATVKLPCRAQGRPHVRIVWDRIGGAPTKLAAVNNDDLSPALLDDDHQEQLLAKAKIMSFRSKREHVNESSPEIETNNKNVNNVLTELARTKREISLNHQINDDNINTFFQIPDLYIDENNRDKSDPESSSSIIVSEFKQIMRDENQESYDKGLRRRRRRRKKRDLLSSSASSLVTLSNDLKISTRIKREDNDLSSDSTPILFFSTPSPTEANVLEVNDNGELILRDVSKSDQGWYACAALNEAGSTVKKVFVRILSDSPNAEDEESQLQAEPPGNHRWGTEQNIVINTIIPVSSTSLDIAWEIREGIPSTTLTLHYRPVPITTGAMNVENQNSNSFNGGGSSAKDNFQYQSVLIDSKEFTLTDLKPHTEYEIFATVPQGLAGSVSNIRKGKTMDGPPSAPPTDVRVGVINNTAAYVRWSPPPMHLLNGELTGYKIQIKSNTTNKLLGQMSLNATTQSVVINSLSPGGRYIARVAPLTAGGLGPYSPPAPLHMDPSFIARPPKSDPATAGWTSSWMSGVALGVLGLCLVCGAICALIWARRNKRNMKASYPGVTTVTTMIPPDKQHTLWLHGNSLVKPTHSLGPPPPPQNSEYAELTHNNGIPKITNSAPPEPYATVTLQRGGGGTSDDSCVKCSASPSSSEYNAPIREPINLSDVLPPPPDHPYGTYRPPNNMTIRTNPAALSPQVMRRIPPTPPRWGNNIINNTMPPVPPLPNYSQNWMHQQRLNAGLDVNQEILYSENDYESGSVLYEQCFRPDEQSYFHSHCGIEPTEEFYRNVNMEFFEDQEFEPSTPPAPCPETPYNTNNKGGGNSGGSGLGGSCSTGNNSSINSGGNIPNMRLLAHHNNNNIINNNSNLGNTNNNNSNINNSLLNSLNNTSNQDSPMNNRKQIFMRNNQQIIVNGINGLLNNGCSGSTTQSAQSSDSESDDNNHWAAPTSRNRRSRSRSKSSDRKYRNIVR